MDETIAEAHSRLNATKHAQWVARRERGVDWVEAIMLNPGSVIFPLDPIVIPDNESN